MNRPVFQFRVIFAVCDEDIVERMNRNRVKTAGKMRVWIIGHDEIHLAGFQQIDALGRSLVCHLDVDIRKGAVETVQVRNKEIAADCVARADAELAAAKRSRFHNLCFTARNQVDRRLYVAQQRFSLRR